MLKINYVGGSMVITNADGKHIDIPMPANQYGMQVAFLEKKFPNEIVDETVITLPDGRARVAAMMAGKESIPFRLLVRGAMEPEPSLLYKVMGGKRKGGKIQGCQFLSNYANVRTGWR